jgi:hypothetical protein
MPARDPEMARWVNHARDTLDRIEGGGAPAAAEGDLA